MACDLVIASDRARLLTAFGRIGEPMCFTTHAHRDAVSAILRGEPA